MPDEDLFRSPEEANRIADEIIRDAGRGLPPAWPAGDRANDMFVLSVQGRGIKGPIECNGLPLAEVRPAWWQRLFNALTPWRLRTRVFTNRA